MVTFLSKQLCLFSILAFHINLAAQSPTATQVLGLEQMRFDAMVRRDTFQVSRLLADDLRYVHSNALIESKSEHLRTISSGKIIYQEMVRESANVRIIGKSALSAGVIRVKGLLNQNPFDTKMLYTAVYRKKGKTWLLASWQTTKIP